MVSRDHRNTGTTDCLCWVFSATSTVGFFLLQGHSDTKWPSLYLWNFSHTIHQCCVSFTSLDWKDFHLSDSIFWALSCLVSLVLLQSFDSAFLKNAVSRTAHSSTEDLALQSWKEYFSPTSYKNEKSPFFNDSNHTTNSLRPEQSKPCVTWGHIIIFRHTVCSYTYELVA